MEKIKDRWKVLFFALLGINIIVIISIILLIFTFTSNDETPFQMEIPKEKPHIQFQVNSNKEDINQLINHYLSQQAQKGPITYEVVLRDEVELYGFIEIFNQGIQMKMTFVGEALENGDLLLRQTSLSIGRIQLPASFILNVMNEQFFLPSWITIYPNERLIHLSLDEMELKSNIKVKFKQFDLVKNKISFDLIVPMNE